MALSASLAKFLRTYPSKSTTCCVVRRTRGCRRTGNLAAGLGRLDPWGLYARHLPPSVAYQVSSPRGRRTVCAQDCHQGTADEDGPSSSRDSTDRPAGCSQKFGDWSACSTGHACPSMNSRMSTGPTDTCRSRYSARAWTRPQSEAPAPPCPCMNSVPAAEPRQPAAVAIVRDREQHSLASV